MKILLTSCGLETTGIQKMLSKCMNDLLKCKINKENITVYDLHKPMYGNELTLYDIVYLCGGNPEYLLSRINAIGFNNQLLDFINHNGIIVRVSAGSMIFANDMPDNLGLIKQRIDVHCSDSDCEKAGIFDENKACYN